MVCNRSIVGDTPNLNRDRVSETLRFLSEGSIRLDRRRTFRALTRRWVDRELGSDRVPSVRTYLIRVSSLNGFRFS